jgi:hypothetical protein
MSERVRTTPPGPALILLVVMPVLQNGKTLGAVSL